MVLRVLPSNREYVLSSPYRKEGEVVRNANDGADDLSGRGQQRSGEGVPHEDAEEVSGKTEEAEEGEGTGEKSIDRRRREEIVAAARVLERASDSEIEAAGLSEMLLQENREYHYSGMLPAPQHYREYDAETRERMCRWNDAFTIDESNRQNELVKNEIKQQNRGAWMTFFLLILISVLSFVSFVITKDAASFWMLSLPVANVIGNLFVPVLSRSSRGK